MDRGAIGACQICGEVDRLVHICTRCYKRACDKPDCMKAITEIKMCGLPERLLIRAV